MKDRKFLVLVGGLSYGAKHPVLRADGSLEWTDTSGRQHVAAPGDWEEVTDRPPSPRFDN